MFRAVVGFKDKLSTIFMEMEKGIEGLFCLFYWAPSDLKLEARGFLLLGALEPGLLPGPPSRFSARDGGASGGGMCSHAPRRLRL